jgi:hypothetical protein
MDGTGISRGASFGLVRVDLMEKAQSLNEP